MRCSKTPAGVTPLTRYIGPEVLLAGDRNTIVFESDPVLKSEVFRLFATNLSPEAQASCLSSLMCCLPQVSAPENIGYDNVFRVLIMAFMDAVNFDVRAMKKSCVHIAQPDGRLIPFEAFNLLYRDGRRQILDQRRAEVDLELRPARGSFPSKADQQQSMRKVANTCRTSNASAMPSRYSASLS